MGEEKFILFDSFLVKKSDIIYALQNNDHTVELHIKKGDSTQKLTMKYADHYDAQQALKMLGIETDAITLDHHKSAIVKQMGWLTRCISKTNDQIENFKKELNALRIELRRNRLNAKKDK